MTAEEILSLIEDRTQESLYLEFKRGDSLGRQNNQRVELLKDVTGFANADGGRIIYGIAESRPVDGIAAADSLAPLADPTITREWLSSTIHDHASPRFHDFDIEEIAVEGGRVLVVDIKAAGTAHQTLLGDLRYYQRAGVTTRPLEDFRIRDLMSRGTRPLAEVVVRTQNHGISADLHRYSLRVAVTNVGNVTMEKWWLNVDVPAVAFHDSRYQGQNLARLHALYQHMAQMVNLRDGGEVARLSFGDPLGNGARFILHPGQSQKYDPEPGHFPEFIMEVDHDNFQVLSDMQRALTWTLYLNNAQPVTGIIPFADWCRF
ncbi:hypothetical protein DBV14_14775 [Variovorax sp. KBW07]|uniref:AlbA family DNA-binding domain-containing protein n=1 Tax=Variovorax sp. KBW07 TaxID=2153358 RepID=UPI000F585931|nr:ATP-binding protein [Variovorax sp. KBW07]RQO53294.1 hypothetical protein DBV14_14775 [Variovorax sp. KBW07]